MICDDCIKSEVCKLKDRCRIFEDRIISPVLEGWVTVEIKCKHRDVPLIHKQELVITP